MPLINNLLVTMRDRRECIIWGCGKRGVVYFHMLGIEEELGIDEYWECIFHFGAGWYLWVLCGDMVRWVKKRIACTREA